MAMHTEMWFPSVIWSSMLHSVKNDEIKRWAYEKQKQDKGRIISNYGGWQSNDIKKGEHLEIDKLINIVTLEIDECCRQTGLPQLEIQNIWLNINPSNAYNHLHRHTGCVLSGCYYVDAKPEQGNIQFERADNADCFLPATPVKNTYFTSTRATYASKTGGLYIFPSWLRHSVEGNKTLSDRISIAFNYGEKK